MKTIEVKNLSHHFNAGRVLKDINLSVEKGQLVAIMGPNGMGKSTLLSIIGGVVSPFRGEVFINELKRRGSVAEENEIRRSIFYLPDNIWTNQFTTGREYLLMVGRAFNLNEVDVFNHIEELAELFNMTSVLDNLCNSYSSGQYKKLGLCSALVSQSKILLLDEPFSGGLDSSGLFYIRKILKRLAERKDVTVLMTVPVPELIDELAHKIAIIINGEIKEYDTPANLRNQYSANGTMAEVLEKIVNPLGVESIERYLDKDE